MPELNLSEGRKYYYGAHNTTDGRRRMPIRTGCYCGSLPSRVYTGILVEKAPRATAQGWDGRQRDAGCNR